MLKHSACVVTRPLGELGDDELMRAVLKALWSSVKVFDLAELKRWLAGATPGQAAILAVSWCHSEVRSGGFMQLFTNATGHLYVDALAGFARIGATEQTALFVQAADALLGGTVPPDQDERNARMDEQPEAVWDRIEALDEAYDAIPWERGVEVLAARYVRTHPGEFFLPRVTLN